MNDKLESEITCQLCRRLPNDPRLLECLHSFCRSCIADKLSSPGLHHRADSVSIVCSVCSHITTIKKNGKLTTDDLAATLKKNAVAIRLIAEIRRNIEEDDNKGGSHGEVLNKVNGASQERDRCNGNASSENGDVNGGGTSWLPSDDFGLHVLQACQVHDGEQKKYFCQTCQYFVCASCVIMEHAKEGHEWTTAMEAAKGLKADLEEILLEADSQLEKVTIGICALEEKMEQVPKRMQGFRDDIMTACDNAIKNVTEYLERKRRLLLERIKSLECSSVAKLQQSRKEGQVIQARLGRVAEYGRNVTAKGSLGDILEWKISLQESLQTIPLKTWSQEGVALRVAALDPELRLKNVPKVGGSAKGTLSQCQFQVGHLVRPGNWQLVRTTKLARPLGDIITAIAALPNGNVVMGYQMNGLYEVDDTGKQVQICNNVGRILDISHVEGESLIVLNTSGDVSKVSLLSGQVSDMELDKNLGHLRCLTARKDDALVTGIMKRKTVHILRNNGTDIETLSIGSIPHRLAVSSNHIAVCHDQACLSIIDESGDLKGIIQSDDWAYASVCSSGLGDFLVLSAQKHDPKSITIARYSTDGRLLETVASHHSVRALGWLNPRMDAAGGRIFVCAEDELITFEQETVILQ